MRKYANEHGLQSVHLEIITYLNICNRYSNTVQMISDYLGQTKSSISQSVSHLEEKNFIQKKQALNDKRIFHLQLTAKGTNLADAFDQFLQFDLPSDQDAESHFESALKILQQKNNTREFGICKTCRHNQEISKTKFRCGLTMENLNKEDIEKICGEYESF